MQLTLFTCALLAVGTAWAAAPSPAKERAPEVAKATGAKKTAKKSAKKVAPHDADCDDDHAIYEDEETWRAHMLRQLDEPPKPHEEPQDPDPWAFSSFRGVRPEPMGEQTDINGALMRIASLTVDLPPHVVEEEYLKAFSFAGVVPMRAELPGTRGVRYLSYRPDGSKNLKTLTLVPNGPGTVVLASIGDPSPMVEPPPDVPPGFPLPPGSERGVTIRQQEPGASTRSSTFLVRGVNPTQVRGFYRTELNKRGFRPQNVDEDTETYANDQTLLSVTARAAPEPDTVHVTVVWLH